MFNLNLVPNSFRETAIALNKQCAILQEKIKAAQTFCDHTWSRITEYDPQYSPKLDGVHRGAFILKAWFCPKCNLRKVLEGEPYRICYICGCRMQYKGLEPRPLGLIRIFNCCGCGHEYETERERM